MAPLRGCFLRPAESRLIFDTSPKNIWAQALREMGGHYALYAEMPIDPTVN